MGGYPLRQLVESAQTAWQAPWADTSSAKVLDTSTNTMDNSPEVSKDQPNTLKQLRDFLNLSQTELAFLLGCSQRKVSRGENGSQVLLTLKEAKRLDRLMRVVFRKDIQSLPDELTALETLEFLQEIDRDEARELVASLVNIDPLANIQKANGTA